MWTAAGGYPSLHCGFCVKLFSILETVRAKESEKSTSESPVG